MAEGRDYPVEYAVNLSLDDDNDDEEEEEEGEYEDFDEAALVEELKQRLQRYTLPGLGHTSFQQLNAKAAIAAAHHRAYIQVGTAVHPATAGGACRQVALGLHTGTYR